MTLWYVDNTVGSSGAGTSWGAAWKNLSNIVWGGAGVLAGDTIYISGGSTSQSYNETFTIGASGTAGNPILITCGIDAGHTGTVIIDAQVTRANCIDVGSRNYVTIQNMTIQNTGNDTNLTVNGSTAGVIIQNIISNSGIGPGAGGNARCYDIRSCTVGAGTYAVILQNCIATTPDSGTTSQTDTLYTQANTGILVQNNSFTISHTDPTGHSDCWQSNLDVSVVFRYNAVLHPNGGVNNHGIIIGDVAAGGTIYVYSNVVTMGSTSGVTAGKPEAAIFRQYVTAGKTGITKIWNNTIYGGFSAYDADQTAGALPTADEFKNNIIYMLPITVAPYHFQAGNLTTPANTDYNLVYFPGNNLVIYNQAGSAIGASITTVSQSSGLKYFEAQLGMTIASGNSLIGIGNASALLTNYTGNTVNSAGWQWNNGSFYTNGAHSNTDLVTGTAGDVIAFAVDLSNNKLWLKNLTTAGGWNNNVIGSQNPASNVGGYSISGVTGAKFIMASVGQSAGDTVILNTGATTFVGTLPSGYAAWGGAFDPAKVGAAASLTPPIAWVSGVGYRTWAQWQTAGYDAHGVNADPQFVAASTTGTGYFAIQGNSPAINAGVTIATVTNDFGGVTRPQGAAYDIGAFEGIRWASYFITPKIQIWNN